VREGTSPYRGTRYRPSMAQGDGGHDGEAAAGRPRDEEIDHRILEAAISEVGEHGVRGFSVARVARGAGVARNSLYLRWPQTEDLVIAAVERSTRWDPIGDHGSLAADLRRLADVLSGLSSAPRADVQLRFQLDTRDEPGLRAAYRERVADPGMTLGRAPFARAAARGELASDADPGMLFELFLGGIYMLTIFHDDDGTDGRRLDQFVDHFVALVTTN